jgi:GT2 family glycosyltransferase
MECERQDRMDDVTYYPYGVNRGLSKSWNEGILAAYNKCGADLVVVANDDIKFSDDDVDKMVEKATSNMDKYIVTVAGYHIGHDESRPSHGFSCFAINPIAIKVVGMFDQNIFPIYLEDCDYSYRARLAGMHEANCPDTMVYHQGSSAINVDERLSAQNVKTHGLNFDYYRRKWGGINGEEIYERPFNDERFDFYIDPKDMARPYGSKYDRTDFDVIKM